jgi:hypothetical protein
MTKKKYAYDGIGVGVSVPSRTREELALIEFSIETLLLDQLLMSAFFNYAAVLDNTD